MPQASEELRAEFEHDGAALAVLEKHYFVGDRPDEPGLIRPIVPGHWATAQEKRAIQYLIDEWDYTL